MKIDGRDEMVAALRDRLSRMSGASMRINESLELDEVLQGVLDSARSLTDARYALITTLDDTGQLEDFLVSGLSEDEGRRLVEMPGGVQVFEYLSAIPEPLRVADLAIHSAAMGLPELRLPAPVSSFLAVPIRHRGVSVGNIHVAKERPGQAFSREDEETLVMFASQVALVVANARRHRVEQRARADLETLINTSPVGVVVFDIRNVVDPLVFNREARRIVDGLRRPDQTTEDLLGLLTVRRADGTEISLTESSLNHVLSVSETVRAEEIVMEVPDGRSITVLINATPIRSGSGEVESVVVTMQDMTPLEEMERLRAEFLGMVSHELRTPLTSIRGSATAVLDARSDLDPAELRQFLRIIVDQVDIMRELIVDLLDVARIETGTLPVNAEPAEVAALVDRARNNFLSAGGRNRLEIDVATDLPLVMADKRRVVQVIGNLLSNAARNSPESSVIRVAAVRNQMHVEISVSDGGRGIPVERLPHLFRKFYRDEIEDTGGDTGLGLAICKGIVEAHGGRISAESDGPGLGARFTFTIPALEETATEQPRPAESKRWESNSGVPVLVVDDDPHTLRFVRKALSEAGYAPIVTAAPEEALPLVIENNPHLVLLDMMLPGTDGIELMRDIFGVADVPVIFLSAYGRDEVVARAFDLGAADYIVKPFSPTELIARARAALRRTAWPSRSKISEPYVLSDLTIDYTERLVTLAGRPVQMTATEYQLLLELSVDAGQVLTHDQLLRRVWGPKKLGDLRALRAHVRRIRVKLGEDGNDPTYLFSVPKVGYRMPKGEGQGDAMRDS